MGLKDVVFTTSPTDVRPRGNVPIVWRVSEAPKALCIRHGHLEPRTLALTSSHHSSAGWETAGPPGSPSETHQLLRVDCCRQSQPAGSCGAGSGHPSPSCHQSSRRPSCEIRGGRSLGLGGQGDAPRSGAGVRVSRRSRPRAIVTSLPELSHRRVLRVDSFLRLQDVGAQSAGSAGPLPARGGSPPSEVQAE